jgi:hypothetical protein
MIETCLADETAPEAEDAADDAEDMTPPADEAADEAAPLADDIADEAAEEAPATAPAPLLEVSEWLKRSVYSWKIAEEQVSCGSITYAALELELAVRQALDDPDSVSVSTVLRVG